MLFSAVSAASAVASETSRGKGTTLRSQPLATTRSTSARTSLRATRSDRRSAPRQRRDLARSSNTHDGREEAEEGRHCDLAGVDDAASSSSGGSRSGRRLKSRPISLN